MKRWTPAIIVGLTFVCASASAIPRSDIVARAPEFENHNWTCTAANLTADCADSSWQPARTLGKQVGLPYCWGGWTSVETFDEQISAGWGAGSLPDGIFLDCTTGVDCSGYISRLWQHPHKLGTSTIPDVSTEIATTAMLPGDVFNKAGQHVIMFLGLEANGDVITTEATNASACLGVCRRSRPWSTFAGYIPRAYVYAELASNPGAGTVGDPIVIHAFPFIDSRNTEDAQSDSFDFYSAAPDVDERGPEFVYVFHVASGGTLTASITDAAGVDLDVHLLSSPSANDCLVRDDTEVTFEITNPGTYYLTADTFVGSSGTEYTGAYVLEATFTGELEAPEADAGPDASHADAGPDAGLDAGLDALGLDAAPVADAPVEPEPGQRAEASRSSAPYTAPDENGCSCNLARSSRPGTHGLILLLALALTERRRRVQGG